MRRIICLILFVCLWPGMARASTVLNGEAVTCRGNDVPATIKYAVIDDASSGDNTLIAAVTGKSIRVLSYTLVSAGTVTARFESGASGTALTGQMTLAVNNIVSANCGPYGCFETASGVLLNLELSGAISVDGHLTYIECD